jgi:integrase
MIVSRLNKDGTVSDDPLARYTVNKRIKAIRHIFGWGVAKELVKPETHYALTKLPSLKRGRSEAKEVPPVTVVSEEVVGKTLSFLPSPVAAMVRLQILTAMRPGEVRAMRACDIDTSRDVWHYVPWEHKTEHHGIPRLVALGPLCQSILLPYLMDKEDEPEAWLFSPQEAMAEHHVKARERRQSKVQPSQRDRSKPNPKTQPGGQYRSDTYGKAIRRAAEPAKAVAPKGAFFMRKKPVHFFVNNEFTKKCNRPVL